MNGENTWNTLLKWDDLGAVSIIFGNSLIDLPTFKLQVFLSDVIDLHRLPSV